MNKLDIRYLANVSVLVMSNNHSQYTAIFMPACLLFTLLFCAYTEFAVTT